MIDATIASLQTHAPVDCLCVVEDGLGLDPDSPRVPSDDRVPCATVAGDGQRHLRLPAQAWMQAASEALQQPCVPRVSDRVTAGVGAEGQNEPEARRVADQHPERHVRSAAALDAPDLGLRDPTCLLERPLTEPRSHAGAAQLSTEVGKRLIRQAITSVVRSFSRDHRHSSSRPALYPRFIRVDGPPHGSTVERATASRLDQPGFPASRRRSARVAVQNAGAPPANRRFTHGTVHGHGSARTVHGHGSASRTTPRADERDA